MSTPRATCSPHNYFVTPTSLKLQAGVATLVVIIILLFSISGLSFYAANTGILEQKISINDYRAKQLSEASDAGLDVGVSWLTNHSPNWIVDTDNAGYEKHSGTINTVFPNGLSANVVLRRLVNAPEKVTLIATAMESAGTSTSAVSRTEVLQNKLVSSYPNTPLMINGCLSGVTGNPSVDNQDGDDDGDGDNDDSGAYDIVSSQNAACVNPGHLNSASDPAQVQGNAFTGTAWDRVFGLTQAEMEALAAQQSILPIGDRSIHWITDSSPWHTDLGSTDSPIQSVIVVFTSCPKINGGTTIVGIAYFVGPCSSGGWGGGKVFGTVIMEGDMTSMNANTSLVYDDKFVAGFFNNTSGIRARIPGSWIDQDS